MKIDSKIIFFVAFLTILHIWDILFFQYKLYNANIWTLLSLLSLAGFIFFASKLINDWSLDITYVRFVFATFMIYETITLIRGIPTDYTTFKNMLQQDFVIWPFLIPLFIFFEKRLDLLAQLFKAFYVTGIIFLCLSVIQPNLIVTRSTAEHFIHPLAYGSAFLVLNGRYLSKKKKMVCYMVTIIAILSFTYLARRNSILTFSGYLFGSILFYIRDMGAKKGLLLFPVAVGLIFLIVFGFDYLPASLTSKLNERLNEDTRSIVFSAFDASMKDDLVFGKGMNGSYYCPFNETVSDDGTVMAAAEYRTAIENGYRQLILFGGQVQLGFFLLLLVPAAYLGLFKSANNLARSCGVVIVLWLVDMAVYGLPRLFLQYVFVWICVGLCYKKTFREIPEEDVYEAFENAGLS